MRYCLMKNAQMQKGSFVETFVPSVDFAFQHRGEKPEKAEKEVKWEL